MNAVLATVVYTPGSGYSGSDTLHVSVDDLGNTGGPAQTASLDIGLTVNPSDMMGSAVQVTVVTSGGYAMPSLLNDILSAEASEIDSDHVLAVNYETGHTIRLDTQDLDFTGDIGADIHFTGGFITGIHVYDSNGDTVVDMTGFNIPAVDFDAAVALLDDGDTSGFDAIFQSYAYNITGGAGADTLVGGNLADIIDLGAGTDQVLAGGGNDIILVHDASQWNVDGGDGVDTIRVVGAATLMGDPGPMASNVEIIDLNTTDPDTIRLDPMGIAGLNDAHVLRVLGNSDDTLIVDSFFDGHPDGHWVHGASVLSQTVFQFDSITDDITFDTYTFVDGSDTLATVYVQQGVVFDQAPMAGASKTVMFFNTPASVLLDLPTPTDPDDDTSSLSTAFGHPFNGDLVNGSHTFSPGDEPQPNDFADLRYVPGPDFGAGSGDTFSYTVSDPHGASSSASISIQSIALTPVSNVIDFEGMSGSFPYPFNGFNFVDFTATDIGGAAHGGTGVAVNHNAFEQAIQLTNPTNAFQVNSLYIQGINGATSIDIRAVVWDGSIADLQLDLSGGGWVSLPDVGPVTTLIFHVNGPVGSNYQIDDFSYSLVGKLDGTYGDDLLIGNSDPNYLLGNSGNDTILGGGGRDVLVGGSGNDILTGGMDADTFVFRAVPAIGSGQDTITDFTPGQDKISLSDYHTTPSLQSEANLADWKAAAFFQDGSDTIIHLDGNDTIRLKNVLITDLHVSDFIVNPAMAA
jgi:Ca2+-binding RTX toxin-like protein